MSVKNKSALQRQSEILRHIEDHGRISIQEIVRKYNISEPTAWRDLKALERVGDVKKVYGGALRVKDHEIRFQDFEERLRNHKEEKVQLSRYAAETFIEDGDIVFLDGGTTIMTILPFIKQKNVTIITNGAYTLLNSLQYIPHLTVISPGGELRRNTFTFTGPVAQEFFKEYYANKFFTSGVGISIERGITDPGLLETEIKRSMVKRAEKIIGIFDSSKIGKYSMTKSFSIDTLDILILNEKSDRQFISDVRKIKKIDLHLVKSAKN